MSSILVGTQLIIFGGRQDKDLAGVLTETAAAGYDGVETTNLHAHYTPDQVQAALDANKLKLTGSHAGYKEIADDAGLRGHIEYLHAHGGRYLMCSGVSDPDTVRGYEESAGKFNEVGRRCADEGIVFCFHNHDWEFRNLGGRKGIHVLGERTDPNLVKFCIDVYWVHVGGEDPAAFVRKYANRGGYFHFKDGDKGWFAELGAGKVDLKNALAAVKDVGVQWIIAEQDTTQKTPAESLQISRRYLKTLGV